MDWALLCSQSSQELKGLSVVVPCYKEDPIIVATLYTELTAQGAEVIVVDDGNSMEMPSNMPYITYPAHVGYGYAIKQGIRKATNPTILTMDSDNQHQIKDVLKLYTVYKLIDDCSMVIGTRWNLKEKAIRWIGRKSINLTASLWARHFLQDLNSGMRIFRRDLALGYQDILCDTFSFTTSLTMSIVTDGHKVAWFPIDVRERTFGKSHVRLFSDGLITMWYVFYIGFAFRTRGIRGWIRKNPITRVLLGIGLIIYGIIGIFIPGVPGDALCLSGLICISPNVSNWCIKFYKKHPKLVWVYVLISTILGVFVFPYIGFQWIRRFWQR